MSHVNDETPIRVGLLGAGFAAAFHYEALRRVYGVRVEVVGLFAPTASRAAAFAAERGLQTFASADALIAATDVVHLCTPPVTHEQLAVSALTAGRSVVVEKPFTGYFGDGSPQFDGRNFDRRHGLAQAMRSARAIVDAEREAGEVFLSSGASGYRPVVCYAENWVYAPAIQKEREIIEKTGAQILWMHGEESHSGSHSPYYGQWKHSGGGSIMGKGVHPLTAALYLKRVEARARGESPIRPIAVSARAHSLTRLPNFKDQGHLRTSYTDVEDFGAIHLIFSDGTIADIFAGELVLGGVHNWLEVNANNHRAICNINPNTALQTYNPVESNFDQVYVVEKIGTKQGWAFTSPDEDWFTGYQHEMEAFYRAVAAGEVPESNALLGADTTAVVYAAYLSAAQRGMEVEVPLL